MGLALARGSKEYVVAQEVGRQQWLATGVEGLEDHLSVIAGVEVDGDDLQGISKRLQALIEAGLEGRVSLRRVGLRAEEELGELVIEEEVSFDHGCTRVRLSRVLLLLQGMTLLELLARHGRENVLELWAIALGRPNLETVDLGVRHHPAIHRIGVALLGDGFATLRATEVAVGRQKDLKRGQPLLPIDNLPLRYVCDRDLLLVEHHRPEEMHGGVTPAIDVFREFARNILPQGLPVVGLVPDILPLK